MALVLADRVRDTTTTTGTGTVTLSGTAPTGYQNFSVIGNGNTCYYTINAGSQWEVGIGTYSSTGPTLARTTILASSSSGSAVDFAAGTKDVFVTYPAGKSVNYDASDNVGIGTTSPTVLLDVFSATAANLSVRGNSGTNITAHRSSTDATGPNLVLRKSRGTSASQTAVATGDNMGTLVFSAFGGTNNRNIATIASNVEYYVSDSLLSSNLIFSTTSVSTTPTEVMRIDSTGKVGIGTASPTQKLEVVGQTVTGNITVKGDGSEGGQITLNNAANSAGVYNFDVDGGGNGRLFTTTNNANLQLGQLSGTGGIVSTFTGGSERMRVDTSGNVGIGTTSPASLLHVKRGSNATENYPTGTWASRIINATDATTENGLLVGNRWAADTSTIFEAGSIYGGGSAWASYYKVTGIGTHIWGGNTSGTEYMRLTSSGSLGLGTSAPSSILHAVASSAELRAQNTNTGQFFSGRVRLKGPAGTYRSTALVHGNNNAGGTNTYFAIEGSDSSDNYLQTLALYDYASQYWGFSTNSSEKMRIDSSGNVGIGTSSPLRRLDISGGGFAFTDAGGAARNIHWGDTTNIYPLMIGGNATSGNCHLNFSTNTFGSGAIERMRIDASGNVGIGTTAPQSKMEIRATSGGSVFNALTLSNYVGSSVGTGVALYFDPNGAGSLARAASIQSVQSTSGNYADLRFFTANSDTPAERMRIAANGNIGVNTTTPSTNFEINGGLIAGSENRQTHPPTGPVGFKAQWNYTGGFGETDFYNLYSIASDSFRFYQTTGSGTAQLLYDIQPSTHLFYTGGTERMRITSGGLVGIGTSSPQTILHLSTTDQSSNRLRLQNTGSGGGNFDIIGGLAGASNAGLSFYDVTNAATRMYINSSGDVVIGATTASGKLHVESASTGDTIYIAANTGGTAGQSVYVIPIRTAGTLRGGIQWNGTNLLYNNSSDARLKDNVADADDASSLIDAIQVRKFDWKESGTHQRYGFIAQELAAVAPESVHQPEDEEEMMGVDYSKLVPMLIKEVQSLRTRVAELEGK